MEPKAEIGSGGTPGSARQAALDVLCAFEKAGAWSDGQLNQSVRAAKLDARDAALAARLCYGVLQNRMLLDFYLAAYSNVRLNRMETRVLNALRLGTYQLLFMDKIPSSAAVNESVALVRKHSKNPKAAGLTNAILRQLERSRDNLPTPTGDAIERLSVQYSHPAWLVKEFCSILGAEETEALLRANNENPPITAQTNTTKTTAQNLKAALEAEGVTAEPHPFLPDALYLSNTGNLRELNAFKDGLFYIQDAASRLAVQAAGARPGMDVLDLCAAPGGKSFAAAIAMENRGSVTACDIYEHKKALIDAGATRLGLNCVTTLTRDATVKENDFTDKFDLVLADVPCSGLGIIRKKPDIRYKDPAAFAALPALTGAILNNAACCVKPGGVLLYSTCTLRDAENGAVISAFLAAHPNFAPEPFALPEPIGAAGGGMLTLWPHRHQTDGFYIAKLRRNA